MQRDTFTTYNPITNFIFFIGAIVMGMFFIHPVFVICAVVCSLLYYFSIRGRKALKMAGWMLVLFVLMSVLNPVFNQRGQHILFTYFGRAYTLEALLYGITLGGMMVATLAWFGCYNAVMTSDKFIYLFGPLIPALSLVLSMILRLIPEFTKKTKQITLARVGIGMAGNASAGKIEKVRNGTVILGALTSWALEGGIVTADSMRARGYGSGKRSNYSIYRFDFRNILCTSVLGVFLAATVVCAACGATHAVFIPQIDFAWFGNPFMFTGMITYLAFMLIPTFLNIKEAIVWHVLRSRI